MSASDRKEPVYATHGERVGETTPAALATPPWSDARLSEDLPVLRARGEGQELEYMRSFPTQASDLAKEAAAFSTSNDVASALARLGSSLLGRTTRTDSRCRE